MPFHYSEVMLNRIQQDPGVPVDNPTRAAWQDPPHPLAAHQSPKLPEKVDVLVIGSGITACSLVRNLLAIHEGTEKPTIAVLEARTLCSGATGRNGGHLRDTPSLYFSDLVDRYGAEKATKMLRFRASQIPELLKVAQEEGLADFELREVEGVDIICEQEKWEITKEELDQFDRIAPVDIARPKIWGAADARDEFGIPKALGAVTYPAATHSTYKLITGLWQKLLERYPTTLYIETLTPAIKISVLNNSETTEGRLQVLTPRGRIETTAVVHCTNSHVGHLVSGLRGKVFPVREQMTEQHFKISPKDSLRSTAFLWRKGFDYFIHRPDTPERQGAILLGGALSQSGDDGFDEFGVPSDADRGLFIAAYLRGLLPTMYDPARETKLVSSWTGIMGWSADLMPWVGRIPASLTGRDVSGGSKGGISPVLNGEWLCAGYSGEGMTHAWGCGRALAAMMLGKGTAVKKWFPEEYGITEKRAEEADVRKLKELY
ncbi:putative FAD dependent oxidoreductase-like protein [Cladorrhinum sp. PSN259]|nr:putative FAD dependent oxidoreductase-like protein [Cladorrhinum sp. PSN259]